MRLFPILLSPACLAIAASGAFAESGVADLDPPCDAGGYPNGECQANSSVAQWCHVEASRLRTVTCGADRCLDLPELGSRCVAQRGESCARIWFDRYLYGGHKTCARPDGGLANLACELGTGCIELANDGCEPNDGGVCFGDHLARGCTAAGQPAVTDCSRFGATCSSSGQCIGAVEGTRCNGYEIVCADGLRCGQPSPDGGLQICEPGDCNPATFVRYCLDDQRMVQCNGGYLDEAFCPGLWRCRDSDAGADCVQIPRAGMSVGPGELDGGPPDDADPGPCTCRASSVGDMRGAGRDLAALLYAVVLIAQSRRRKRESPTPTT